MALDLLGKNVDREDGFHIVFNTGEWGNHYRSLQKAKEYMYGANRRSTAEGGESVVALVVKVKDGEVIGEYR